MEYPIKVQMVLNIFQDSLSLSKLAYNWLIENKGWSETETNYYDLRYHPDIIAVVKALGEKASEDYLSIEEYEISSFD